MVFDAHVEVLLGDAGDFELEDDFFLVLVNVDGGHKAGRGQCAFGLVVQAAEQGVQPVLHGNNFTERVPTGDCHNSIPPGESKICGWGGSMGSPAPNPSDETIA